MGSEIFKVGMAENYSRILRTSLTRFSRLKKYTYGDSGNTAAANCLPIILPLAGKFSLPRPEEKARPDAATWRGQRGKGREYSVSMDCVFPPIWHREFTTSNKKTSSSSSTRAKKTSSSSSTRAKKTSNKKTFIRGVRAVPEQCPVQDPDSGAASSPARDERDQEVCGAGAEPGERSEVSRGVLVRSGAGGCAGPCGIRWDRDSGEVSF